MKNLALQKNKKKEEIRRPPDLFHGRQKLSTCIQSAIVQLRLAGKLFDFVNKFLGAKTALEATFLLVNQSKIVMLCNFRQCDCLSVINLNHTDRNTKALHFEGS